MKNKKKFAMGLIAVLMMTIMIPVCVEASTRRNNTIAHTYSIGKNIKVSVKGVVPKATKKIVRKNGKTISKSITKKVNVPDAAGGKAKIEMSVTQTYDE